jgi:hypothetical protein
VCAGPDEESFRRADVVFVGKLLASDEKNKTAFEVQQVIKGAASGTLKVDTSQICEYDIFLGEQGNTYVVYAQKHQGMLSLKACGGTRQIEDSKVPVVATCNYVDERRPSLRENMIVTAICVSLSLSLGYLVNIVRKRFR